MSLSRIIILVLGPAAVFVTMAPTQEELPGRELGAIQGVWEVLSIRQDGAPNEAQIGTRVIFRDHEVTFEPPVSSKPQIMPIVDGTS